MDDIRWSSNLQRNFEESLLIYLKGAKREQSKPSRTRRTQTKVIFLQDASNLNRTTAVVLLLLLGYIIYSPLWLKIILKHVKSEASRHSRISVGIIIKDSRQEYSREFQNAIQAKTINKGCSIKFSSKHSIVLVLCLLRNLMEQTLS